MIIPIADLSDTEEASIDIDVGESGFTVEGNLFFNNAMKKDISFNNKKYNRLFQKTMGYTDDVGTESDEFDNDDSKEELSSLSDNGQTKTNLFKFGKRKQVSCKIDLYSGIFGDNSDTETTESQNKENFEEDPSFPSHFYLTEFQMIRCVDFAFILSDIGILVADIGLLFLYDDTAFDIGIFWSIFLFNLGVILLFDMLSLSLYLQHRLCIIQCLAFNECDYDQKEIIKNRMKLFVCFAQYPIFMCFCSFSKMSIILYSSIPMLTLFAILCEKIEKCNESYRNPKVLDRAPHSLWSWCKSTVIGLQTLPFLYFTETSFFHTMWFYIAACAFIWYPHILEWINFMRMNVANNMICEHFITELNKKWGQKISQYELRTGDLTINQLPHSETMRWLNLMKLWLERFVCFGWTVFVLVLCALCLMRHQYSDSPFGFVWSVLYIIVSCGIFILCLCDCLTTRH